MSYTKEDFKQKNAGGSFSKQEVYLVDHLMNIKAKYLGWKKVATSLKLKSDWEARRYWNQGWEINGMKLMRPSEYELNK